MKWIPVDAERERLLSVPSEGIWFEIELEVRTTFSLACPWW
jgi:hypothetical protein